MANIKELLGVTSETILENLSDVGEKYIELEKIIPKVNDLLTSQAEELRRLNKELGNGSKTVASFRGELSRIALQTGINIDKQYELLDATNKYHQGITDTTKSTLKFIKASGVSAHTVGEVSARLTILGDVSEESFNTMYEGILSVRNQLGLTVDQIEDVLSITKKYATIVNATEGQINRATFSLAKLTSQLTKAGWESSEASDLINNIIDPDKIMDNVTLLSKVGLSVGDLFKGDPLEDIDRISEGLKNLGTEILNISKTNRFQANEVAKIYGLTLEQANTLANLDTTVGVNNAKKTLDQYRNEMSTFTDSIKSFTTAISGGFGVLLTPFGNILQKFTDSLSFMPRSILAIIGGVTLKKIFTKVNEYLGEAARKFAKNVGEGIVPYLNQVAARDKQKTADALGLSPKKESPQRLSYGMASDFLLNAELKRDEFNKRIGNNKSTLSSGEIIEGFQSIIDKIQDIEKYGASLVDGKEKTLFKNTYGIAIEDIKKEFASIFKDDIENLRWDVNSEKTISSFIKARGNKQELTEVDRENINKVFSGDASAFGFAGNEEKTAELMSISSGPKEFFEKVIEFWNVSKDPKAVTYIEKAQSVLNNINDGIVDTIGGAEKLTEVTKRFNNLTKETAKGNIAGPFKIFKGITTNIGTFFGNLFNNIKNFISPKKLLGGALGGIGIMLAKQFSKNEKFQEATEKLSNTVSKIFDSVGPLVEGLSERISSIIDFLQPAINWIAGLVGKFSNLLGGLLKTNLPSIKNSVSTIEDSYKKENLKDMILSTVVGYDKQNDILFTKVDELVYAVKDMSRNQMTTNEVLVATAQSTPGN